MRTYKLSAYELDSNISSSSDDEDEQVLDKNGKRGECGTTSDEEEIDKRVAKKLKKILSTLDLTPKTLKAKKKKLNSVLLQSKIVRASKISKKLFTFDGANNVNDESDSEEEDEEEKEGN